MAGLSESMAEYTDVPQIINLLLLIAGVIVAGIGLAAVRHQPVYAVLLLVGVALVAVAYYSDQRRATRRKERARADAAQRIRALTGRPWNSEKALRLRQSFAGLLAMLLLMAVGGGVFYFALHDPVHPWPVEVVGAGMFIAGALFLPRMMAGVGRPALELTSQGVTMPLYGRIPWRNVSGIAVQSITTQGRTTHRLMLRVPRLVEVASQIHWTDRLLAVVHLGPLVRNVIAVPLAGGGEKPEVVDAVARFLWKQATGNDYPWSPLASDAVNEALRRTGELATRAATSASAGPAMADPRPRLAEMRQAERDAILIGEDLQRRARKLRWGTAVVIAVVLARFAWLLVELRGRP